MRVFTTRAFDRFARKQRLSDNQLVDRIKEADDGLVDANLGGVLIKLRIAR